MPLTFDHAWVVSVLGKISDQGAPNFEAAVAPVIPAIVELLKDFDSDVRSSASLVLVKFSEQEEFLPLVRVAICVAVDFSDKTHSTLPKSPSIPLQRTPIPSFFPSHSDRPRGNLVNVLDIRDIFALPTCRLSSTVDLLHSTDCLLRHEAIRVIQYATITSPNFSLALCRFDLRAKRKVLSDNSGHCSAYVWYVDQLPVNRQDSWTSRRFWNRITHAIADIVELLKDSSWGVHLSALSVPGKVSEQAEFRAAIAGVIPAIVKLLMDSGSGVRSSAVSVLGKVSEQAEFRATIAGVIPPIVKLLMDSGPGVRSSAVSVLGKVSEQAEFRAAIAPFIPAIVQPLKDYASASDVRSSAVSVLGQVSEKGAVCDNGMGIPLTFDESRISSGHWGVIPAIVELLKDSDSDVRSRAVSVLGKVSEQAEFRAAIEPVRLSALSVLGKVSEQAEFRATIAPVIPAIVKLLKDSDDNIRSSAVSVLSWGWFQSTIRSEFRPAIADVIPAIVEMRSIGLGEGFRAMCAGFRVAIAAVIPAIVELLNDFDDNFRSSAVLVLEKVSDQSKVRSEFRAAIEPVIPAIVALLKESDSDVRESAVSILENVSEQAEFRAAIAGVIPAIVALLKVSDSDVRESAVSVLGKVSEQAEFQAAIEPVIPAIVALLKESDSDIRERTVSVLGKVSEQAEFRAAIVVSFLPFLDC
ncbi:armadillo-type protein [Hysterangium stoloniferum]|nr:armadillo-type protein [Hysterangium stoloniferum]